MADQVKIALVLSAVDRASAVIRDSLAKINKNLVDTISRANAMASKSFEVGRQAGVMAVGASAALAVPIRAAVDFETAMLGVAKQMEGARDEAGKLTPEFYAMQRSVLELSKSLPMGADQLAELSAAGLRMGVANKDIAAFTETAVQMATAFDVANPEEIASSMGKISTIFKLTQADTRNLADAINYLDDNAISKGGEIIEVLQRVGGTAAQIGLAKEQTAALASTFLSLGKSPEVAATATNALIRELAIAQSQPKRFKEGLAALGLEASKIQSQMASAPMATIQNTLEAINRLPKEQQITVTTQIFGKEFGDDVALLATSYSELQRQLELVNPEAAKFSGSMSREFSARMQTSAARLDLVKNQTRAAAIQLGTALLPTLQKLLEAVTPMIEKLSAWIEKNPGLSAQIGKVVAGFAAMSAAASGFSFIFGGTFKLISGGLGLFKAISPLLLRFGSILSGPLLTAFGAIRFAIIAMGRAMLANPILAVIGLIASGALLIIMNWDKIVAFFKSLWDKIKTVLTPLVENFKDFGAKIMEGLKAGIMAYINLPLDIIKGLGKKISDGFKNVLKIQSPSKIFVEHGHDIAMGAALGIAAATPSVANAVDRMGGAVLPTNRTNSTSVVSGSTTNTGGSVVINYSPTITVGAGASKGDFASMLEQHKSEIARIVTEQQRLAARRKFSV